MSPDDDEIAKAGPSTSVIARAPSDALAVIVHGTVCGCDTEGHRSAAPGPR
jgi:hypothetical protein